MRTECGAVKVDAPRDGVVWINCLTWSLKHNERMDGAEERANTHGELLYHKIH